MKNKRLSVHMDTINQSVVGLLFFADYMAQQGHPGPAISIRLLAERIDEAVGYLELQLLSPDVSPTAEFTEGVSPEPDPA